jgi:hypothetical protein
MAVTVPADGTTQATRLGLAGATSGRQDEVATPPHIPTATGLAAPAVAEASEKSADEVRAGLDGGHESARMAGAQGVDPRTVVDALAAAAGPERPDARGTSQPGPIEAQELAALVGFSTAGELRAAQAAGRTLAEIAEANGVDPQRVVDALIARSIDRRQT